MDGLSAPRVSIVIPVLNRADLTLACLQSLEATAPAGIPFELIIVDNGSTDQTPELLACLEGDVTVIRNEENLGFGPACNQGAAAARGELILFLNNDTVLLDGWLEPLVEAMDEDGRLGAVQPKLLFPDGRLNDAGGLMFAKGEAWSYGKHHPVPDAPQFSCRRAPDYVTGACLLVRKTAFGEVGGFDDLYAPAYYEDTDLSFALRAANWKLLYEPRSVIIHVEGGTAGTDEAVGLKRHQVVNKVKFIEKWADELAVRPAVDPSIVEWWAHRPLGGFGPGESVETTWAAARAKAAEASSVLVFDPYVPAFDRNSGHVRLFHMLTQLRAVGHHVSFYALNGQGRTPYVPELGQHGIALYGVDPTLLPDGPEREIYGASTGPGLDALKAQREYDVIVVNFWFIAEQLVPQLRAMFPRATIVVDSIDLHWVRETRQAQLAGDKAALAAAEETRRRELAAYALADRVVVLTEADEVLLREQLPHADVVIVPNAHAEVDPGPGFDDRSGFMFVGNFNHLPNHDAVSWWSHEIGPAVARQLPEARLRVVGNDPAGVAEKLASGKVDVVGWVPDTLPELHRARVSVAPLRYGSGMKGKVGEALAAGLPTVVTSMAAEGMQLEHEVHVLVADDAAGFAAAVARLHEDRELWERLRDNGRSAALDRWGPKKLREPLAELMRPISKAGSSGAFALSNPAQ